ncbi:MAG: ABC transporter permease [Deltaproteobacteria bacterium]|nr:ABC transporter permease [Deltaproteobacteria bacterium]
MNNLFYAIRSMPFFATTILILFVFFGVFGGLLTPHDPNEIDYTAILVPPVFMDGGTMSYPLGTDELGRDILSRLLAGTGVSLQVGFVTVVIAGLIGSLVALLSGYMRGWTDTILMRITDIMLSMPLVMVSIVLSAVLGPSKNNIIVIFSIMGWSRYARVLRGEVLRLS